MSGKLPIDRAREAKFSRKLLEEQKQRMGNEQAQIRDEAAAYEESRSTAEQSEEEESDEAKDAG